LKGLLLRNGRGGKRGGDGRGREGRGGLSGNVAEEAFCLESAPALSILFALIDKRMG